MNDRQILSSAPASSLLTAYFVSLIGDFIAVFAALSVLSFRLHANAVEVSSITVAYLLPQAFTGPLAGIYVDRWSIKRVLIICDLARAMLAVLFVYAGQPWQIYAIFVGISVASSIFTPAQTVLIRQIVPRPRLLAANSLMLQMVQVAQILSPALAASLTHFWGEQVCFWIDSGTFLFSATVLLGLAIPSLPSRNSQQSASLLSDFAVALRFIRENHNVVAAAGSMAAALFAIRCFGALMPVYIRDVMHQATGFFGLLGTLVGIGMVTGAQLARRLGARQQQLLRAGTIVVAVPIITLGIFESLAATTLASLAIGATVAIEISCAQASMQGLTPIEILGRVASSLSSAFCLVQVAALLLCGWLAKAIGVRYSYMLTGACLIVFGVLKFRKWVCKKFDFFIKLSRKAK